MLEYEARAPSPRLAGAGRTVYAAGAVALLEPGPAASGLVVTDEQGRSLARRAQYLGPATRQEATARALLDGLRLAFFGGLAAPLVRADDAALVDALRAAAAFPADLGDLAAELPAALAQLPGARVEYVSAGANPARAVALEPLADWLPERARRSEELRIERVGPGVYAVDSASNPGQRYRVTLPAEDDPQGQPACECADFQYRGIPCKHLLAVARETGALPRLFAGA